MGLYKGTPPLSGRMGALWSLSAIGDAAVVEFGCMGHMAYGRTFLHRMGSAGAKLYSTHIGETDIAMGNTQRLSQVIGQLTEEGGIKLVFLLPSAVPEVIGIDLAAIAQELAPQFPGLRLIALSSGGFDLCGHKGVEQTLLQLAKELPKGVERTEKPSCNIIGSCADMFRFQADAAEISRLLTGAFGMETLCVMTSDATVTRLEQLGAGHINLVIRREGEAAAKHLQDRFQTPYLLGRPYGINGTIKWLEQVAALRDIPAEKNFLREEEAAAAQSIRPIQNVLGRFLRSHREESQLILAGHADILEGIAIYGKEAFGFEQSRFYCDCPAMVKPGFPYLDDEERQQLEQGAQGFLMADAQVLRGAGRDGSLQIANPDNYWRHPYEPPFVGFRGAVHLATIWANEMARKI